MLKQAQQPEERLATTHKEAADFLRISDRKLNELVVPEKARF